MPNCNGKVLSDKAIAILMDRGCNITVSTEGIYLVKNSPDLNSPDPIMSERSASDHWTDSPYPTNASDSSNNEPPRTRLFIPEQIPEYLESAETIRFLEFDTVTAEKMFKTFQIWKSANPKRAKDVDLGIYVAIYVERYNRDKVGELMEGELDLKRLGATPAFEERLRELETSEMRPPGETVKDSTVEMVKGRWEFLKTLDRKVRSLNGTATPPLVTADPNFKKLARRRSSCTTQ